MSSKERMPKSQKPALPRQTGEAYSDELAGTEFSDTLMRRANRDFTSLTANQVLQLQRTIGNQAVMRLMNNPAHPAVKQKAAASIQRSKYGFGGKVYETTNEDEAKQLIQAMIAAKDWQELRHLYVVLHGENQLPRLTQQLGNYLNPTAPQQQVVKSWPSNLSIGGFEFNRSPKEGVFVIYETELDGKAGGCHFTIHHNLLNLSQWLPDQHEIHVRYYQSKRTFVGAKILNGNYEVKDVGDNIDGDSLRILEQTTRAVFTTLNGLRNN